MKGYNDDLVMSLSIGLWIRDTALKIRNEQIACNKKMIEGISKTSNITNTTLYKNDIYDSDHHKNWKFTVDNKKEDLNWLL